MARYRRRTPSVIGSFSLINKFRQIRRHLQRIYSDISEQHVTNRIREVVQLEQVSLSLFLHYAHWIPMQMWITKLHVCRSGVARARYIFKIRAGNRRYNISRGGSEYYREIAVLQRNGHYGRCI